MRDARQTRLLLEHLEAWTDDLRALLDAPGGTEALTWLLRYIALVGGEVTFAALHAKLEAELPEAADMGMTIAQQLRREGRAEGRRGAVRHQLELEFGKLLREFSQKLAAAGPTELDGYLERVLSAQTLAAVFEP